MLTNNVLISTTAAKKKDNMTQICFLKVVLVEFTLVLLPLSLDCYGQHTSQLRALPPNLPKRGGANSLVLIFDLPAALLRHHTHSGRATVEPQPGKNPQQAPVANELTPSMCVLSQG